MARDKRQQPAPQALCVYEECRFCVHRVNASKTPSGEGQCNLELQGRAKVGVCRGQLFFTPSPDRLSKYKSWILRRTMHPQPSTQ